MSEDVVIVGAGHAGGTAAALLRQYGFAGRITLVGDEGELPYSRPPLSKAWLKGDANAGDLHLKPALFYEQNSITLCLDQKVEGIDPGRQMLYLSSGAMMAYDQLILATGSRPRRLELENSGCEGIVYLREMRHAAALKERLTSRCSMVILGGGYIGLEVAATARQLGIDVTVLEREPRLLSRVASQPVARFLREVHEREGVTFRFGMLLSRIETRCGRLSRLVLDDGSALECDLLLVGIGVLANDELAREAGLACEQGVVIDGVARTSDPHIYAIGDVARRRIPGGGVELRIESVSNALDQAKQVASAIAGRPVPPAETPWFWSDQYTARLQIVGLAKPTDTVVVRPAASPGGLTVLHLEEQVLRAAEVINGARDFLLAKRAVAARRTVARQALELAETPLSALLA